MLYNESNAITKFHSYIDNAYYSRINVVGLQI